MWKPLIAAIRKALPKPRLAGALDSSLHGSPLIQVAVTSPRTALFSCEALQLRPDGWSFPLPFERGIPSVKIDPQAPSRAYQKLAEALAILHAPAPTSALDLGAAPGGWTRHLLLAGADVQSVDRRVPHAPSVTDSVVAEPL